MAMLRSASRLVAVLGPTNTGKTHLAIERMLGHKSGMIGFPLRLLARENYDRVVKLRGARAVALITGEEKILPPNPAYFVCTVESMPLDRPVDFLAVDEIQLCADPERGHVFTARLLHARGLEETMFLGSDTIKNLMRRLVPGVEFAGRPRFSTLSYTGHKKVTRLPPRSAVVAFAVADVFSLAELVRRQRGGTAVVLGALSPRARNAQVGMFQAGEVDYLVATDAIGMGLNMDLDHVAFARTAKFDGRGLRRLSAAEIAQIAGRAGRHMSDGTFGATADEGPLDPAIVEAVEAHRFDPLARLNWRNVRLDVASVEALLKSLEERPSLPGLVPAREADDHRALRALARNQSVMALATHPGAVRLLWEVCQIPDFRKVMSDSHARLLAHCYLHLAGPHERLPTPWIASQMTSLDRLDGDIDTLMARIAHIRTWTYIAHRADWVEDAAAWQERARGIEDRLSDALHDRITQRFVDRRSAFLVRQLAGAGDLLASVSEAGEVRVEGAYVGRLDGLRFVPDASEGEAAKTLMAAANRVLRGEVVARARRLIADADAAFAIDAAGLVRWRGGPVGRLAAGDRLVAPQVAAVAGDFVEGEVRDKVRERLQAFLRTELQRRLAPLFAAEALPLAAPGRGLVYQLVDALGALPAEAIRREVAALGRRDRAALAGLGLRFGRASVYFEPLLGPEALRFRALLWAVRHARKVPALPGARARAKPFAVDPAVPPSFWAAIGFPVLDGVALRPDRLERLAAAAQRLSRHGPFAAEPALAALVGADPATLRRLLVGLGYRAVIAVGAEVFVAARRRPAGKPRRRRAPAAVGPPFA
ncbi:MAG TPA: helicase-related protein, partial [Stellaceae bacterium]|nr:helicase-related protein [Stellaceae bacterium]